MIICVDLYGMNQVHNLSVKLEFRKPKFLALNATLEKPNSKSKHNLGLSL